MWYLHGKRVDHENKLFGSVSRYVIIFSNDASNLLAPVICLRGIVIFNILF